MFYLPFNYYKIFTDLNTFVSNLHMVHNEHIPSWILFTNPEMRSNIW